MIDTRNGDVDLERRRAWIENFEKVVKKDKVRFAVVRPDGRSSGVWAAWAYKSDYYIGARSVLGSIKISLHQSGICRVAFTDGYFQALKARGITFREDRAFHKWRRKEIEETGAVHVASLLFPQSHLHLDSQVGSRRKPLLVFESRDVGTAVEVGFFFSREKTEVLEKKLLIIGNPIFRSDLDNGESVSMVVRQVPFDQSVLPTSEFLNSKQSHLLDPDSFSKSETVENLTAMLFNAPGDGETLQVIEIGGIKAERSKP